MNLLSSEILVNIIVKMQYDNFVIMLLQIDQLSCLTKKVYRLPIENVPIPYRSLQAPLELYRLIGIPIGHQ
jgi:hypothetical protein